MAAGGIMDGDGMRAVTTLGAIGAQLGTAFVVCPESAADASYRAALLDPGVRTEITSVISGRPARGIVHRFMREAGASSHPPLPDYPIAYDAGKALNRSEEHTSELQSLMRTSYAVFCLNNTTQLMYLIQIHNTSSSYANNK